MQCKELEAVLADDEISPLPAEAREHLAGCRACRDLLADLSAIALTAKRIPAEIDPPQRIWVSLRAQLEAEGIIRETGPIEDVPAASWWMGLQQYFRPRVLATVAATLVVAGGIYLAERPTQRTGKPTESAAVPKVSPADTAAKISSTKEPKAPTLAAPRRKASSPELARVKEPSAPRISTGELAPSPSEVAGFADAAGTLSETENTLPARRLARNAIVDAAQRQNLRTLNEFIAECETRLKQNPQDRLTREYLNMAYQQKAELLTAMLDSGRSEH